MYEQQPTEFDVYDFLMVEWGIPFDYIEDNWTERQFRQLLNALTNRKEKEMSHIEKSRSESNTKGKKVSFSQFHSQYRGKR